MKINFKNLGAIKEGTIDLNKLNIFCGENNTGKTYLNYFLYTVMKVIRDINLITERKTINKENFNGEEFLIDGAELLISEMENILSQIENRILEELPRVFNIKKEFFSRTQVKIELSEEEIRKQLNKEIEYTLLFSGDKKIFWLKRKKMKFILMKSLGMEDRTLSEEEVILNFERIVNVIFKEVFFYKNNNIFVLPAERSGLSIFYNELLLNRSNLLDDISRGRIESTALSERISRYPEPINDYINFLNNIPEYTKKENTNKKYIELAEEIEAQILHGKYEIENNRIVFKDKDNTKLDLYMSSSTAKTILGIIFYLKHMAQENDYFLIDEPELNLHPDNQRKLARIFIKMINAGINVFMTTHSPYIISELNNMIMLSEISNDREMIMEEYKIKENEILNKDDVICWLVKEGKVKEMKKSQYGIEADTFNEVIDSMNNLTEELYSTGE